MSPLSAAFTVAAIGAVLFAGAAVDAFERLFHHFSRGAFLSHSLLFFSLITSKRSSVTNERSS